MASQMMILDVFAAGAADESNVITIKWPTFKTADKLDPVKELFRLCLLRNDASAPAGGDTAVLEVLHQITSQFEKTDHVKEFRNKADQLLIHSSILYPQEDLSTAEWPSDFATSALKIESSGFAVKQPTVDVRVMIPMVGKTPNLPVFVSAHIHHKSSLGDTLFAGYLSCPGREDRLMSLIGSRVRTDMPICWNLEKPFCLTSSSPSPSSSSQTIEDDKLKVYRLNRDNLGDRYITELMETPEPKQRRKSAITRVVLFAGFFKDLVLGRLN